MTASKTDQARLRNEVSAKYSAIMASHFSDTLETYIRDEVLCVEDDGTLLLSYGGPTTWIDLDMSKLCGSLEGVEPYEVALPPAVACALGNLI